MRKHFKLSFAVVGFICMLLGAVPNAGAAGGGYTPGVEGVMAATVPPPGVHWRMYNVIYEADTLTDNDGNDVPIDFDIEVFATVHRLVWITQQKFLGADFGVHLLVPIVNIDLGIGAFGVSDGATGLGDICLEPIVLAWHKERYDVALGLAMGLPTGDFDATAAANSGIGGVFGMLTLGGTVYFDEAKSWSASILTRSLVYGEQEDTDITPGSEFFFDWGIGKQFPVSKGLLARPGICGYSYWQISDDDGPGTNDDRGQVHAIGAEFNLFWLPPHLWQANIRVLTEFGAEDEAEGTKVALTLTKSF